MSLPALQPRRTGRLSDSAAAARARLSVVPRVRTRAPRMPFLALVTLMLVGGVVGLLMFNTQMQQASFAEANLEDEASALTSRQEQLEAEIENLRDPQRVAQAAQEQGMVLPAATGSCSPTAASSAMPSPPPATIRCRSSRVPPSVPACSTLPPSSCRPRSPRRASRAGRRSRDRNVATDTDPVQPRPVHGGSPCPCAVRVSAARADPCGAARRCCACASGS